MRFLKEAAAADAACGQLAGAGADMLRNFADQRLSCVLFGGNAKFRPITKTLVLSALTVKSWTSKTRRSVSAARPARATT